MASTTVATVSCESILRFVEAESEILSSSKRIAERGNWPSVGNRSAYATISFRMSSGMMMRCRALSVDTDARAMRTHSNDV